MPTKSPGYLIGSRGTLPRPTPTPDGGGSTQVLILPGRAPWRKSEGPRAPAWPPGVLTACVAQRLERPTPGREVPCSNHGTCNFLFSKWRQAFRASAFLTPDLSCSFLGSRPAVCTSDLSLLTCSLHIFVLSLCSRLIVSCAAWPPRQPIGVKPVRVGASPHCVQGIWLRLLTCDELPPTLCVFPLSALVLYFPLSALDSCLP